MRNRFRPFLVGLLGVAAFAVTARGSDGDRVTFDTLDGVTLEGTFYAANPAAKAKNTTVLLLHNFGKTGGSSHQDGWDDLAKALSDDGFSVLSFDFRGFGNSKTVSPSFWDRTKSPHNVEYVRGGTKASPPTEIDHALFDAHAAEYYPFLVNDVAAAKSYLDRHPEKSNSSNLIVIGAGEGATVGAMWMASQWHLQKIESIVRGKYTYEDPEGRDEAGAVWLDISPTLGGREVAGAVRTWIVDEVGANKVPALFIYGKENTASEGMAKRELEAIEGKIRRDNPGWDAMKVKDELDKINTGLKGIDTKLGGSGLLTVDSTIPTIKAYLDQVVDVHTPKDPRAHDVKMDNFMWTFPGAPPLEAKLAGEDYIHLVPVDRAAYLRTGQ